MIDWIDGELAAWGRWAVRAESGGLGYANASPMFAERLGRPAQPLEPATFTSADLLQVDQCVRSLAMILRLVVILRYQYGLSSRVGGEHLGIAGSAFGRYLADAHAQVERELRAIRRGLVDSAEERAENA